MKNIKTRNYIAINNITFLHHIIYFPSIFTKAFSYNSNAIYSKS